MVGIIGAFTRITEIVAFPFTVFGNALKVRAQEIVIAGNLAIKQYWDLLFRISVLATLVTGAIWFMSPYIARIMLPEIPNASRFFLILTVMILFRSLADLFAPASDYVGGLGKRLVFLLACAGLQPGIILIGILFAGEMGAVVGMVSSYGFMVLGYVIISKQSFFGIMPYHPTRDTFIALLVLPFPIGMAMTVSDNLFAIIIYMLVSASLFCGIPSLRKHYVSKNLLALNID
jgi:O-antigen/teichoic acid export membrane protein